MCPEYYKNVAVYFFQIIGEMSVYGSLTVEGSIWIERGVGAERQVRSRRGGGRETQRERVFERALVIH